MLIIEALFWLPMAVFVHSGGLTGLIAAVVILSLLAGSSKGH